MVRGDVYGMRSLSRFTRVFRSSPFQISLRRDDLWRIELGRGALPIRCLSGTVWITREGSGRDVVLPAGETCELRGKGLVLVSAVPEAEVCVGRVR